MHFEKTMCDRLGYKYKDLFGHLEFILNKTNNLLNNYGCGLSDKELEMLSELFLKLETRQIEIIEFTRPIEKYLDVDEIYKENKLTPDELANLLNQELIKQRDDYKSRCKKAIEYNKEIVNNYLEEDNCEYCDGRYATAKHNLNILQNGSDDNE